MYGGCLLCPLYTLLFFLIVFLVLFRVKLAHLVLSLLAVVPVRF